MLLNDNAQKVMNMAKSGHDRVHRVHVDPDTGKVHVTCIGMDCVDDELQSDYNSINDMPEWVQRKIAILMLCDADSNVIDTIGRRASAEKFWIFGGKDDEQENVT